MQHPTIQYSHAYALTHCASLRFSGELRAAADAQAALQLELEKTEIHKTELERLQGALVGDDEMTKAVKEMSRA